MYDHKHNDNRIKLTVVIDEYTRGVQLLASLSIVSKSAAFVLAAQTAAIVSQSTFA